VEKPTVLIERWTPSKSSEVLDYHNPTNRKIYLGRVIELAQLMKKNGGWEFNGSSLVFDSDGDLANGQHRLSALVRTGCSLDLVTVRGVKPKVAQDTMDRPKRRSIGDQLDIDGEQNANNLAASLRVVWDIRKSVDNGVGWQSVRMNVRDAKAMLIAEPEIRESLVVGRNAYRTLMYSIGAAGGLHHLFATDVDREFADEFWRALCDIETATVKGDPIGTLRVALIRDTNRLRGRPGMSTRHKVAITIRAWQSFCAGGELRALKWFESQPYPDWRVEI